MQKLGPPFWQFIYYILSSFIYRTIVTILALVSQGINKYIFIMKSIAQQRLEIYLVKQVEREEK